MRRPLLLRVPLAAPAFGLAATAAVLVVACKPAASVDSSPLKAASAPQKLMNVSYDPTRELYEEYNRWFSARESAAGRPAVETAMSHGGSGKQARAVIDGMAADVVTLALAPDIDEIATRGKLLADDWQTKLPHNSSPYTSTIVFLTRRGNPKQIADWSDLVRPGISAVAPNPKTSGGARWVYLAAWGQALELARGDTQAARKFVTELYRHVPVLDTGARGSSTTFARNGVGDVLIGWENEAALLMEEMPEAQFVLVVPKRTILAEPPVAVVQKNAEAHGTADLAQRYLLGLYEPEVQRMAARHHFRPSDPEVAAAVADKFLKVSTFSLTEVVPGGWSEAQRVHFADGGVFDQIYTPGEVKP